MAWYPLKLQPDGDVWLVIAPDFPEVTSFGETTEEACRNGLNAIEEAIAARIAAGEDIPAPRYKQSNLGKWAVEVPAMVLLKSGAYMLMRSQRLTRADLQRRLGWRHREQIDRIFRLDHQTRLDALEEVFKALGSPLRLEIPFSREAA